MLNNDTRYNDVLKTQFTNYMQLIPSRRRAVHGDSQTDRWCCCKWGLSKTEFGHEADDLSEL